MQAILCAGGVSLALTLLLTPSLIRFLVVKKYGQYIREDGPTSHNVKRGTPTMGGIIIVLSAVIGYVVAHALALRPPTASGMLVLGLMIAMGLVGFIDDWRKIAKERSLGLTEKEKIVLQVSVSAGFALLALFVKDSQGRTPMSTAVSVLRDTSFDFVRMAKSVTNPEVGLWIGIAVAVGWATLIIVGTTNAVNLTDGLDGLAAGCVAFSAGAYVLIGIWQNNQNCDRMPGPRCYEVHDALDLAVVASAITGACIGFLWWNAHPAKIFMGDSGSLALGGAIAGLALTSKTHLLLIGLGIVFVLEVVSVIGQRMSFKYFNGRRIFKMAPIHHHFEQLGWNEVTVVVRFWIIGLLGAAISLGAFYAEWIGG